MHFRLTSNHLFALLNLDNCTFKSKAIYCITPKCDDSRLSNNFTYSFFNGESESIYLKEPCILGITEKNAKTIKKWNARPPSLLQKQAEIYNFSSKLFLNIFSNGFKDTRKCV